MIKNVLYSKKRKDGRIKIIFGDKHGNPTHEGVFENHKEVAPSKYNAILNLNEATLSTKEKMENIKYTRVIRQ